jgi:hypothetical protein
MATADFKAEDFILASARKPEKRRRRAEVCHYFRFSSASFAALETESRACGKKEYPDCFCRSLVLHVDISAWLDSLCARRDGCFVLSSSSMTSSPTGRVDEAIQPA